MKAKLVGLGLILGTCISLCGCGASKDLIMESQAKYKELVEAHNQVVEAYASINDSSLNDSLITLSDKVSELKEYNLFELSNEELSGLIDTMDSLNESYSEYLKTIGEIKINENKEELSEVKFSIINDIGEIFDGLSLMEKGETDLVTNAIEGFDGFNPGEKLAGLTVYFDQKDTPWVLNLTSSNGEEGQSNSYSISLDKDILSLDGVTLHLKKNDETGEIYLEKQD